MKQPTTPFSTKLTLGAALLVALLTIVGMGAPKTPMHWSSLSTFKQPEVHGEQHDGHKSHKGEPVPDSLHMAASAAVDD